MASVMMLMSRASSTWHGAVVALSIALIFAATYLLLRSATLVNRVLGPAAMAAVQRVLGLMLAATAIQFIVEGGLNLLRSASA
jgi:multiple antibiotic resistance protein